MSAIKLASDTLIGTPAGGNIEYNGQFFATDSNNARAQLGRLVLETAKTATGTSVDFTGIPSWVKRITVMFNGLSTNGGSNYQVQLGDSGGIETTGYVGRSNNSNGTVRTLFSSGFIFVNQNDTNTNVQGQLILTKFSSSDNTWIGTGQCAPNSASDNFFYSAGSKSLSDTLDRIRITTVNGTDSFDAGSINILYEG